MKTKPNAADRTSKQRLIVSSSRRNGGFISAVILSGLLLACDSPGVTGVPATVAAPLSAQTNKVAEPQSTFERVGQALANQHGPAPHPDLPDSPGAPIAEYGR